MFVFKTYMKMNLILITLILIIGGCFNKIYSQNPEFQWADKFGRGIIYKIIEDASGNVYSVGHFINTIDLDPGAGTASFTCPAGLAYSYISKLDANGNYISGKVLTSNSSIFARNMVCNLF